MTKRKIALLCVISLLATLLSACGKEVVVTPNPASSTEPAEAAVETDTQTAAPENSPAVTDYPDTKDYTITSGGTEQTVTMDLYKLSFAEIDGPDFGIYIDYSTNDISSVQHNETSNYCYLVCSYYQDVVSSYITIDYFGGVTEDSVITSLLGFANNTTVTTEDMGEIELESCTAHVINGQGTDGASYTFYIINTGNGYIAEFLRIDPTETDFAPNLIASAESIYIK